MNSEAVPTSINRGTLPRAGAAVSATGTSAPAAVLQKSVVPRALVRQNSNGSPVLAPPSIRAVGSTNVPVSVPPVPNITRSSRAGPFADAAESEALAANVHSSRTEVSRVEEPDDRSDSMCAQACSMGGLMTLDFEKALNSMRDQVRHDVYADLKKEHARELLAQGAMAREEFVRVSARFQEEFGEKLSTAISIVREDMQKVSIESGATARSCEELSNQLVQLASTLDGNIAQLKDEVDIIRSEPQSVEGSVLETCFNLQREQVQVQAKMAEISGDLNTKGNEIDGLRKDLSRLSQDGHRAALRKEMDDTFGQTAEIRDQIAALQSANEFHGDGIEKLSKQLQDLKTSSEYDINGIHSGVNDLANVIATLTGSQPLHAEAVDQNGIREGLLEQLRNDTEDLHALVHEMRASTEAEIQGLHERLSHLLGESVNLRDPRSVDGTGNDTEDLHALVHEMRASTEAEIQGLHERFSHLLGESVKLCEPRSVDGTGSTVPHEDIAQQMHSLSKELHDELSERFDAIGAEFAERFEKVVEATNLKLDSDVDIEDRLSKIEGDQNANKMTRERLGEVLNLTQCLTTGTEELAKRIASETAAWRAAKLQIEKRLLNIEKIDHGIGGSTLEGAAETFKEQIVWPSYMLRAAADNSNNISINSVRSEPDIEIPSLMSQDLKDSLETLVSKLARTLQPDPDSVVVTEHSQSRQPSREPRRTLPAPRSQYVSFPTAQGYEEARLGRASFRSTSQEVRSPQLQMDHVARVNSPPPLTIDVNSARSRSIAQRIITSETGNPEVRWSGHSHRLPVAAPQAETQTPRTFASTPVAQHESWPSATPSSTGIHPMVANFRKTQQAPPSSNPLIPQLGATVPALSS